MPTPRSLETTDSAYDCICGHSRVKVCPVVTAKPSAPEVAMDDELAIPYVDTDITRRKGASKRRDVRNITGEEGGNHAVASDAKLSALCDNSSPGIHRRHG